MNTDPVGSDSRSLFRSTTEEAIASKSKGRHKRDISSGPSKNKMEVSENMSLSPLRSSSTDLDQAAAPVSITVGATHILAQSPPKDKKHAKHSKRSPTTPKKLESEGGRGLGDGVTTGDLLGATEKDKEDRIIELAKNTSLKAEEMKHRKRESGDKHATTKIKSILPPSEKREDEKEKTDTVRKMSAGGKESKGEATKDSQKRRLGRRSQNMTNIDNENAMKNEDKNTENKQENEKHEAVDAIDPKQMKHEAMAKEEEMRTKIYQDDVQREGKNSTIEDEEKLHTVAKESEVANDQTLSDESPADGDTRDSALAADENVSFGAKDDVAVHTVLERKNSDPTFSLEKLKVRFWVGLDVIHF